MPLENAVGLTLISASLLAIGRRLAPFSRMLLASAGFCLVLGTFVLGSRSVKALVRERARTQFPSSRTLDVVATPMPANPWCWGVLLVQRDEARYFVRLGRAAIWPAWLSLDSCPYDRAARPTAPLRPLSSAPDRKLVWSSKYQIPLSELRAVADARCEARALLQFARVPYLTGPGADQSRVIGDLRYDRSPGLDFSDVHLQGSQAVGQADECPGYLPPWRPPRADILSNP